ncbi:aspartyl-phosphate phosphatase Spo0E family protein [Paenibacillus sp. WLX1005]|uniref:aspartyl-phosphate phosphatase Spo0E family protein n=1 Tax=unclassified Paenibacillus TaxID=185978 RepID=UPI0039841903
MYCAEYPVPMYRGMLLSENKAVWPQQPDDSRQLISLEDEIHKLRTRMELMFLERQSFTAEDVLEISMLLDIKINEYMHCKSKRHRL